MKLPLCLAAYLAGVCASACAAEPRAETAWSFQPLRKPPVPVVKNMGWVKDGVDVFVLSELEKNGLPPNGPADRGTLLRRATFDLVGVPPTLEEIEAFLRDPQEDSAALAKVLDGLLASPRFGERWGRHWLDVVRYADTVGRTMNASFPYAFRYRDWVIDAFNRDLPYDRFVQQQIAGDLLPAATAEDKRAATVATGFLALGSMDLSEGGVQFDLDRIDDQIDVTSRAFLGLTVSCARCHHHKTDAISQADYYALGGIFLSTRTWSGQAPKGRLGRQGYVDEDELLRLPTGGAAAKLLPTKTAAAPLDDGSFMMSAKGGYPTTFRFLPDRAMGVQEDAPTNCAIRIKGEATETGDTPLRGGIAIPGLPKIAPISPQESGRRELAEWLTAPANPLTARVMVNRLWAHLFGEGLVRTVDDFGLTGEAPSNQALLDHLATRFVQGHWSVKQLLRALMLSSTYRLSSAEQAGGRQSDPGNLLHWRMTPRRLEAEAIRDSLLSLAGTLKFERPGGVQVAGYGGKGRETWTRSLLPESAPYRTVYLPVLRSKSSPVLSLFDFPDPAQIKGQREVTTVAAQSLFFMNNGFVEDCAERAAQRLAAAEKDETKRLDLAYLCAFGRRPERDEAQDALAFAKAAGWPRLLQSLTAAAEFRYVF